MKYLTGLAQNPAVTISTYFTVKKFASLAIISQNPGFIEMQVRELFCIYSTERTHTYKLIYNYAYIEEILKKPNGHFTNLNGNTLWHLGLLERWFQLNID